eukprot:354865_1
MSFLSSYILKMLFTLIHVFFHANHAMCGTHLIDSQLAADNPEWNKTWYDFESSWVERSNSTDSRKLTEISPINIPVVFHILTSDPLNHVPDSLLAEQINVLNKDFAGANNVSWVPLDFQQVGSGDMQINFILNQRINKETEATFDMSTEAMKFDSKGGSNVVNAESNLNIWICDFFFPPAPGERPVDILGYAQFPDQLEKHPATDGVVFKSYVLPGSQNDGYLGRTATHEVGHWLNLFHIFGIKEGCHYLVDQQLKYSKSRWYEEVIQDRVVEYNSLATDLVYDTPEQDKSNSGCKELKKNPPESCFNSLDMYMNFMDYSDDKCLVMFTQGQKERMHFSIDTYRSKLKNNKESETKFVSWIYFSRFEKEKEGFKCVDEQVEHVHLWNANYGSDSNLYIYLCEFKTKNMNVDCITDIYPTKEIPCKDGYVRSSQNVNEGNEDAIYVCYRKEPSIEKNLKNAILDVVLFTGKGLPYHDCNDLDINPDGKMVRLCIQKQHHLDDSDDDNTANKYAISNIFIIMFICFLSL